MSITFSDLAATVLMLVIVFIASVELLRYAADYEHTGFPSEPVEGEYKVVEPLCKEGAAVLHDREEGLRLMIMPRSCARDCRPNAKRVIIDDELTCKWE